MSVCKRLKQTKKTLEFCVENNISLTDIKLFYKWGLFEYVCQWMPLYVFLVVYTSIDKLMLKILPDNVSGMSLHVFTHHC